MYRFNLNEYKSSSQYLLFFDCLIKQESVTKDAFLSDLGISTSSYRRSKLEDSKIASYIITTLANHYKVNLIDKDDYKKMKLLVNNIYNDMFYKIYDQYDEYIKIVKEEACKNDIYYPIYKLMSLFLQFNSNVAVGKIVERTIDEYNELKKYKNYFNKELLIIYNMISLNYSFNDFSYDINDIKENNPIALGSLSLQYHLNDDHHKSLHYAKIVKEKYLKENNYKRVFYIDFTILNDLACIGEFNEYYTIAKNNYYAVRSFNSNGSLNFLLVSFLKHYCVATIALKKYEETLLLLDKKESLTPTETYCLIIAKYYTCEDFDSWFNEEFNDLASSWPTLNNLCNYLKNKTNQNFASIKHDQVMYSLYHALNYNKE